MNLIKWALVFSVVFCLKNIAGAQSQLSLNKGSRPPIDVYALSADAFEKGKLSVKFFATPFSRLEISDAESILQNTALKNIAAQFHIQKSVAVFAVNFKDVELNQKHEQWGLHLWFQFHFPEDINIKNLMHALESTHLFEVVEPVYQKHLLGLNYVPNDPRFNEQWAFQNTGQGGGTPGKDISLTKAWDIETGNPNVIVSMHDQGIQLDHPDLAQNIAVGKSYNFVNNNDTIVPGYHGTHTAGTVAAVNNNGIGVSGIAGGNGNINSGVRLMSCQIFNGNQSTGIAASFIYAADNGSAISSNSWAYDDEGVYEIEVLDAIDYFIANGGGNALQGGLVVFAAGNNNKPTRYFPSSYDKVIAVAATNYNDVKAVYSTYGTWVDIAAPGGALGGAPDILSTTWYSGYAFDRGTSMACPHVAGVAALIASKLYGRVSISDVRDILLSTTDNIDTLNPNFKGLLGTGRLNAFKALQKAQDIFNGIIVLPPTNFISANNCNQINLSWQKNAANDTVMIAHSGENNISIPVSGQNYSVGDMLPGGGKVIYKGILSNFSYNNNNIFLHFFKIWSVDANKNYSFGKIITVNNGHYIVKTGGDALKENFDYPPFFPTMEWRSLNPDNDATWTHTASDTSSTGAGDDYSMCMYNYSNNSLVGRKDILVSPKVSVQHADSIILNFWHSYKYRNTGLADADSLEVLVSTDCGINYNSIWKKGGKSLATIADTSDVKWYPFGLDKWENTRLDLSGYKNVENILLGFKAINGKGNNLFLDNIQLSVRYKNDIELVNIITPDEPNCNTQIAPTVRIKNNGNSTVNTIQINYAIDGGAIVSTVWNGTLAKDAIVTLNLSPSNIAAGKHSIFVQTILPNPNVDEFNLNDTASAFFTIHSTINAPLNEGFESANFPPKGWQILQQDKDTITWQQNNLAFASGTGSAMMPNYFYNYSGRVDDLISPLISIPNTIDSAFFFFSHAHATKKNPASAGPFDTLEISISKDCGINWISLYKKWGDALQTIHQTDVMPKEYIAASVDWVNDSINLTGLIAKNDAIFIRFRNTENYGNQLYLDNIKFVTKYTPPSLKQNGYIIYPNPFKNQITLEHLLPPITLKEIRIVNGRGQIVYVNHCNGTASNYLTIPTTNFATGVYTLQLIYDSKIITEKLLKVN